MNLSVFWEGFFVIFISNSRKKVNRLLKKLLPILLLTFVSCNKMYEVQIQFDNVNGLRKGTPVEIDGFKVGQVKNMYINETNDVITTVEIDKEINL